MLCESHHINITKDTAIVIHTGNSEGFRSSVLGIGKKTKYAFLVINHNITPSWFVENFYQEWMLEFVKCYFCICSCDHAGLFCFSLNSGNVVSYMDQFLNIEWACVPQLDPSCHSIPSSLYVGFYNLLIFSWVLLHLHAWTTLVCTFRFHTIFVWFHWFYPLCFRSNFINFWSFCWSFIIAQVPEALFTFFPPPNLFSVFQVG